MSENFLLGLIVACEISFWVALFSGLAARYLLKWRRASTVMLACVPFIDLILLGATVLDLRMGATATFAHGLAAAYIGFTVAFGSITIRWADNWFARRFAGAAKLPSPPTHGWKRVKYEFTLWGRCLLAAFIMCLLLAAAIALVNDPLRTEELHLWFGVALSSSSLWFLFGPLWSLAFSWRTPKSDRTHTDN